MYKSRAIFCLVILVLTLSTAFCKVEAASAETPNARASVDDLFRKAGINRINQGGAAADFTLRDATGNAVTLSASRGSPVFLNFWATWCGPCREEMPSMERLYRELGGQGLRMLAVNEKESAAQVANFIRGYGLSFPALLDTDGKVASAYRVWGLPATYLIDGTGRIIGMKSGPKEWASRDVVDAFRRLLGDSSNSAGVTGSLVSGPVELLPAMLRVKSQVGSLHAQQDSQSEVIAKLGREEEVIPMGRASGSGESWYMVRTKNGAIGWMKANDVEETTKTK
jgi:peroxiredoxin